MNAWNTATDGYGILQSLVNSSRFAQIVIPGILILIGLGFIYKFIYPEIKTQLEERNGLVAQGTTALTANDFLDRSQYISNPAGLLGDVATEAFQQNILQIDTVSKSYNKTFYITIPALNIENLPVTPNVDSTTEDSYTSVLHNSLAHFQNTGLPISEINNNMVIYGHSASPNYNPRTNDPEVAFSFLPNLKVGDLIYIDIDGNRYTYRMYKSKIVEPSDFTIITGELNKRILTLFTCYPPGNSESRIVINARPI
jgi:LPXTG-site transpeptidase (sortase) family protein